MALEARIDRLEDALSRLAEAQARTEERMGRLEDAIAALAEEQRQLTEAQRQLAEGQRQLVAAQVRTEERMGRLEDAVAALIEGQRQLFEGQRQLFEGQRQLTEGQRQLTEGQRQLAAAQARTEAALQKLARQVGGLSDAVGGDIEDIAYIVLYDVLKREFGWEVGVLERTWQQWNSKPEEVNVFGRATDPARPEQTIWIVGEAKHNLTLREAEQFARQVRRAQQHLVGEVYAVCFCYRARPEVRARLQALGIPLLFSYGRFA